MSEIERVRALRDAGQITPEEAGRLIGVLRELDGGSDDAATRAAEPSVDPEPAVDPATAPAPTAPAPTAFVLRVPDGTQWCTVELLAADLQVTVDDVAEPTIASDAGQFEVVPTSDGVRITARRDPTVEGWIGRMRALDVRVRLPRDWGLALDLKAGEATIRDVRFVRGRMLAGDLDVRGAEGVDVSKAAGDVNVEFRPTQGQHRISCKAGDLHVTLLPGSHATVEGSVSMGDLRAPGFAVERRTVGASAHGRIGNGAARVEVRLSAGDLELRAPPTEA